MTLIDLGEVTHDAAPPGVPLNLRRLTTAVLALVALAGTLILTGSAPTAQPTVRPLWTTPLADGDTAQIGGHEVYVTRTTAGEFTLTAHDLATGDVRWTVPAGAGISRYGVEPAGGVVLVAVDPVMISRTSGDGEFWTEFSRATVALDVVTGGERWRTSGQMVATGADGTGLVIEHNERAAVVRFRLVRLSDGREIWNVPTPDAAAWTSVSDGDEPGDIATVTAAGEITLIRYADGTIRRPGRVPWPARAELMAAGPYLGVRAHGPFDATTTVYRPADLHRVWDTVDNDFGYLNGCGPVICAADETGVSGRDPATGEIRWKRPGMRGARPLTPDRLLLDDGGPSGTQQLIDATTGDPVGEPVYGTPSWGAPAESILILRGATTPFRRTAVVRLDLATGAQWVLGTIGQLRDGFCTGAEGYLACQADGTLTVTAVG